MKLTDLFKGKAETKQPMAHDSMELSDDELKSVAGGVGGNHITVKHMCYKCMKETSFDVYSGGRAICQNCHNVMML